LVNAYANIGTSSEIRIVFERVVLMVMGVVIILEVVEVIACWQDGVKSGLEWSWGSNYQVVITLMAVTLVPASTEDGEGSLVVLKEMIFMVVYLLAVVSKDGIGRIVPGDNGGDGSLCLLLVVVLTVCRRKVVSFRISMAPWGSYLVHKSDLQCVIKSFP